MLGIVETDISYFPELLGKETFLDIDIFQAYKFDRLNGKNRENFFRQRFLLYKKDKEKYYKDLGGFL